MAVHSKVVLPRCQQWCADAVGLVGRPVRCSSRGDPLVGDGSCEGGAAFRLGSYPGTLRSGAAGSKNGGGGTETVS